MSQIIRGELQLDVSLNRESYDIEHNNFVLVIDTETHTNISQKAKILMYSVFNLKEAYNCENIQYLDKGIVVYDLSVNELSLLKNYCIKNNLRLLDRDSFITGIFYPLMKQGTMLVGHNIQFDIGAIALNFEVNTDNKYFRFKLCNCNNKMYCNEHPTIVIEPLKSKKSFMYFEENNYGSIVDTITIGNALLGNGKSSLDNLIKRYGHTDKGKKEIDHTYYMFNEYDYNFYDYSMHDVYLTSILIASEYKLYLQHNINISFNTIMSEATIGKAYKKKIGEPAFRTYHTEVPKFLFDRANSSYYGGRSEVNIRLQPCEILYCDFKSQYPLVNALLDTQKYLLAEYLHIEHCVEESQEFLNTVTIEDLKYKETWKKLSVLVKAEICNGIVPMRQQINSKLKIYGQTIIDKPIIVWYTLADIVASKLRTGITPIIVDAYKLVAQGTIPTNKIKILGNDEYNVDLSKDDFFIKVIDLRDKIKSDLKNVEKQIENEINAISNIEDLYHKQNYLSNLQVALKLISNSTAYGMLVETREILRQDVASNFNAMPLGVHITSCARLLIAIAEKLGTDKGLTHVFCDTDSFAYKKPDNIDRETFFNLVQEIIIWFDTLSPYASKDSIFELEKINFPDKNYSYKEEYVVDNKKLTPLYALCISTKRYVLYNKLKNGQYLIRKMSEHGIPYFLINNNLELNDVTNFEIDHTNDIDDIPDNEMSDNEIDNEITEIERDETNMRKFKLDRYMLWYRGIQQIEQNIYPKVINEQWSNQIALTQITISTPRVYNSYKHLDIRPFSFFCVTPKSIYKERKIRYYMPFISNSSLIIKLLENGKIKNIDSDEIVHEINCDTIYDRLKDFFIHPENKSSNSNEVGIMHRRIVQNSKIEKRLRSGKKIQNNNQLEIEW